MWILSTYLLNVTTVRRRTTVVDASAPLCDCLTVHVCLCVCRVVVAPASNFLLVVVFALDDAALLQPVNTYSQCCQLNIRLEFSFAAICKNSFSLFFSNIYNQNAKTTTFCLYDFTHSHTYAMTHTHKQRVLFWRSIEREKERERERTQESARASSAWQTHGFCFWQNTLGGRRSSSKRNMDHLQLVCVCCRCLRQRRFALCTVVPGAAKANRFN